MKRKIKQSVAFLLALGMLSSTAWANDKTSRWEEFCDAMQAGVDEKAIKQAPPPDVTPFQEAQPIVPSMTQVFCTIRVMGSKIYCGAMVGLQPEYMSVLKLQLQKSKDGSAWETQASWTVPDHVASQIVDVPAFQYQYRVRVVVDIYTTEGKRIKQIEKCSSRVWG